jgi:hypothetical protein
MVERENKWRKTGRKWLDARRLAVAAAAFVVLT